MGKAIVIVESPAKARTIEKYLGRDYQVRASAGHIKDLPARALGVDIKNDFRPTYRVIPGKEKVVRELKKAAEKSEVIYLAADPDREGEAICQHLAEELNGREARTIYRVLFNEITKNAILEAFKNPGSINRNKVSAQQTRRILDRLVGYKISPLLWQKVRGGLSAGRVQSVALRMVVDREREIRAFVPEEYWNFSALLEAASPPVFTARAVKYEGKKFKVSNQEEADRLLAELRQAEFKVGSIEKKEKKRRPVPPFITSKLQQEAYRKLRFSVKKTMTLAQRLYEGVAVGDEGLIGLITYMRTDSTRVAESALQEVRGFVKETYGDGYLPAKPVMYQGRKGAQDAHEAIRPTSVMRRPDQVRDYLGRDEFRLYELIWKRFVASQMNPALFDETQVDIEAGKTLFRAVGSVLKFDGFLKLYQEGQDETPADAEEGGLLPPLTVGERLKVQKILPEQKFTQPPPRYTESTLVKALEEKGIGRPSTYAQIVSVILDREYVKKDTEGRFVPTEIGEVVTDLLVAHFDEIFDYDYTARLEQDLDEIENGQEDWIHTLKEFYSEFARELQQAKIEMKNLKKEETPTGIQCTKCGSEMVIRWGRFGKFLACSNYPACKNTQEIAKEASSAGSPEVAAPETHPCDKCGRPMVLKKGRYGDFFACSGYPDCKNTRKVVRVKGETKVHADKPLDESCPQCGANLVIKHGRFGEFTACSRYPECKYIKRETTGVQCPECGEGELLQRKSRRGKIFYSCSRYPQCRFVLWDKPIPQSCPKCQRPYILERFTKKQGLVRYCPNKACDYREAVLEPAGEAAPERV
ncbi:MAG: type I DNA topoisomerase [Acidobacteriota bacterium]